MHANGLHTVIFAEFPTQIITSDKAAEARMERLNMIIFQINFNESFPVVIAFMNFNMIEHIASEI